jgi:hypothetical protein
MTLVVASTIVQNLKKADGWQKAEGKSGWCIDTEVSRAVNA